MNYVITMYVNVFFFYTNGISLCITFSPFYSFFSLFSFTLFFKNFIEFFHYYTI